MSVLSNLVSTRIRDGADPSRVAEISVDGGLKIEGIGEAGTPVGGVMSVQPPALTSTTATIALGASLSGAINCTGSKLARLIFPATFEPTSISFRTSFDGVTYNNVMDRDGIELVISATSFAGFDLPLDLNDFSSANYVQIRGGTAGAPTTVGANRIITAVLKSI